MHLTSRISQAVLALAIFASVIGGVVLVVRASTSGGGIEIILPTVTAVPQVDMKVYVTGAVNNPGVYDVAEDSRLADVLEAAGGPTDDTDLAAVNLATRVQRRAALALPRFRGGHQPGLGSVFARIARHRHGQDRPELRQHRPTHGTPWDQRCEGTGDRELQGRQGPLPRRGGGP